MEFNFYGITTNILDELSYKSKLGKSLKNTLRKFNKDDIFFNKEVTLVTSDLSFINVIFVSYMTLFSLSLNSLISNSFFSLSFSNNHFLF